MRTGRGPGTRFFVSAVLAAALGAATAELPCAQWEAASDPAPWANRSDHAQVTLQDGTVLILGGGDYATNWTTYNDVWASKDAGSTWQAVNLNTPWHARAYLTVTAIPWKGGERLVLVGGGHCIGQFVDSFCHAFEWYAEVWVSDDRGVTWNNTVHNLTSPFMARGGHAAVAVGTGNSSSVLFVGGVNGIAAMNDVWQSDDGGVTWGCIRANGTGSGSETARPGGWDAAQLAVARRRLDSVGGPGARGEPVLGPLPRGGGGVSASSPGPVSAGPATFAFHNLVAWHGRLWVIAGASSVGYVNTVWSSEDGGRTWLLVVPSAPWAERILPATVIVPSIASPGNGTGLLLTGGSPQSGGFAYDDVWTTDDGVAWSPVTTNASWPARGWQMMTTIPATVPDRAAGPVTVVMTGGWTWYFPFRLEWTYFRDAWRCLVPKP